MEAVTPRVFVTNFGGHQYDDAKKYGEIRWLTKGHVNFRSLDRVKYTVTDAVLRTHKDDYLLLSGKLILSVMSVLAWYTLHKQCKILMWDDRARPLPMYKEILITESNMLEMIATLRG